MLPRSCLQPLQVDRALPLQVTQAPSTLARMFRTVAFLGASLMFTCLVACSSDSTGTSGNSSGASSSGDGTSGGGSSSGTTSTSSGSTSTSKFACSINGSCYKCPSSAAVQECFKDLEGSGCTSTSSDYCK